MSTAEVVGSSYFSMADKENQAPPWHFDIDKRKDEDANCTRPDRGDLSMRLAGIKAKLATIKIPNKRSSSGNTEDGSEEKRTAEVQLNQSSEWLRRGLDRTLLLFVCVTCTHIVVQFADSPPPPLEKSPTPSISPQDLLKKEPFQEERNNESIDVRSAG